MNLFDIWWPFAITFSRFIKKTNPLFGGSSGMDAMNNIGGISNSNPQQSTIRHRSKSSVYRCIVNRHVIAQGEVPGLRSLAAFLEPIYSITSVIF